jgi:hypothetical protein
MMLSSSAGLDVFDCPTEPVPTSIEVLNILARLPVEVGNRLRGQLNKVLGASAPGPFSRALGDMETYLSALDDARLLPFENQVALKAYVMAGWQAWRVGFATLGEQ